MVELKNISAKTVIRFGNDSIKELVKRNSAKSAEDVLRMMFEYPEYNWFSVMRGFSEIERKMNLANERNRSPEMFYTKGYNKEDLSRQDFINNGNILLLNNPTNYKTRYICLRDKTIAQIKDDLAHTFSDGGNYVSSSSAEYKNVGPITIPKIISSIEMYEKQIERQSRLTTERDINLFELDKDLKMDIVEEMYNEIIMYLVYNTNERLVWGVLSDAQKKLYLSSAINKKQEDIKTSSKIKEYIANYTTLPELEKIASHDLKVLKRFIVK